MATLTRPVRLLAALAVAVAASGACDERATLADEGPARPATLTFSTQPEYAFAGQPVGPGVAVTVLDTQGDTAFSSTATISIEIRPGTGNPAAHVNGMAQVAAVDGTAHFWDLSIDSAGVGYQLWAIADGLRSAFSDSFDVTRTIGAPAGGARSRPGSRRHPS
jgi:hypothetical protein